MKRFFVERLPDLPGDPGGYWPRPWLVAVMFYAWLLLVGMLAGCSTGDEGDEAPPPPPMVDASPGPDPIQACEDFVTLFCSKVNECDGAPFADCVDATELALDCGQAVAVNESYDRCLEQLDDLGCALFLGDGTEYQIPASCDDAIEGPPQ